MLLKILCREGFPSTLQSDNGSEFKNSVLKKLFSATGMTEAHSRPYSPWVQGSVERANRELEKRLGNLLYQQRTTKWWLLLPLAEAACNNHTTRVLGCSAFEFALGRSLYVPEFPPNSDILQEISMGGPHLEAKEVEIRREFDSNLIKPPENGEGKDEENEEEKDEENEDKIELSGSGSGLDGKSLAVPETVESVKKRANERSNAVERDQERSTFVDFGGVRFRLV